MSSEYTSEYTFFSATQNAYPIVAIQPCLEALISVHIGEDPSLIWRFWKHLIHDVQQQTPYVLDNRPGIGLLKPVSGFHHDSIREAFEVACHGVDQEHTVDWATMTFIDAADEDKVPNYSCTCSIGWIEHPADPRGFSLRITVPVGYGWSNLLDLGRELGVNGSQVYRWITIGYRFVPVSWHTDLLGDSVEIIHRLSKRFLCVDVGDAFGLFTSFWQDKIRSVNFITIVSADLLERLGGIDRVYSLCEPPVRAEKLHDNLLIQAGELPTVCDVNRRENPLAYRLVDRLLRPIRAHNDEIMLLPPWDIDSTQVWLKRFE